jgi:hypothetical protein
MIEFSFEKRKNFPFNPITVQYVLMDVGIEFIQFV